MGGSHSRCYVNQPYLKPLSAAPRPHHHMRDASEQQKRPSSGSIAAGRPSGRPQIVGPDPKPSQRPTPQTSAPISVSVHPATRRTYARLASASSIPSQQQHQKRQRPGHRGGVLGDRYSAMVVAPTPYGIPPHPPSMSVSDTRPYLFSPASDRLADQQRRRTRAYCQPTTSTREATAAHPTDAIGEATTTNHAPPTWSHPPMSPPPRL